MSRQARQRKRRCVVVDVETTGLSPLRGERIIEIGAVTVDGSGIVDEFHSLIDPGTRIALQASHVHGITSDMLAGKPKPEEVLPGFHRFIRDCALVAHNASFDVSFLRYEFSRLGLGFNNPCHCTLTMSRQRFPNLRDHKLETVYRHLFGPPPDGVRLHRALDDARMVARVWMEMMKR
jgi:DNA polymerase-3 subunit epsilon